MPLVEYRKKRHFNRTAEPAGRRARTTKSGWRFVIQKHAASHLHYDFRLEHDGVLKSWAIPHGPSLNPSQKRLAVEVEDHPLEYGKFEGTIPQGEYGGGSVLLWDSGTWSTDQEVGEALRIGKLKFHLDGEKLSGGWNLVRMRAKPGEKRHNWLLIKERDDEARPLGEFDVLEERPESVVSGKTINEIAGSSDKTWSSNRTRRKPKHKASEATRTASTSNTPKKTSKRKRRSQRDPLPEWIEPQLATLVDHPPEGDDWVHEIKLDGYRILAYVDDGETKLLTRKQNDWAKRFPELAEAVATLPVKQAILDGEVVSLLEDGVSDFQSLQNALSEQRTGQLVYYVFDLLFLDGEDLRSLPLQERKARLDKLLQKVPTGRIRYSEHLEGSGDEVVDKACHLRLEGIVSKRRDGTYASGRGTDWLKTKCAQRQEFVIGGYTDSTASRHALGALLVGYFNNAGEFVYAGKIGTGFSERSRADLRERLKAREQSQKSFDTPVKDEKRSTTHWARPELVAEVKFSNWTDGGHLRQPVFQGLREDKPAHEVVLEAPTSRRVKKPTKRKLATPQANDSHRQNRARRSASRRKPASPRQVAKVSQFEELGNLKLTHPDRVLYPDIGLTKRDLVTFYAEISDWILPHVVNRPLSLVRCPEGQTGQCFYQKHASAGTPDALGRVMIKEKDKLEPYLVIKNLAGLLSVVQMGVLEIHPWGSTVDDLEKPDRLIFDLDPDPSVTWENVVSAAKELRDRLSDLGLASFAKTSGGKGLHVVVPIQRRTQWPEAKKFCRAIANEFATESPRKFTANMSKAERRGKIFIDYLRNDRGATAIAPYSTRSRPGAPVATPIAWKEVSPRVRPDHFHVGNVSGRLRALKADPWEDMTSVRQSLTREILQSLGIK